MERFSVVVLVALLYMFMLPQSVSAQNDIFPVEDTTRTNPYNLPYNFSDDSGLLFDSTRFQSPLMMQTPSFLKEEAVYDEEHNRYLIRKTIGDGINYQPPTYLSVEDYLQYNLNKTRNDYWKQRAKTENFEHQRALIPKLHIDSRVFETIFGSNTIDIKPRGKASLKFGLRYSKTDNPMLAEDLRTDVTFDFEERIQMNVSGKIGENLSLKLSYDTEASFEFENEMNIRYQGNEDDIIQRIEAGNVSLPLNGTLIQGSQNLFGILSEMKFGKLRITTLFSQQKSESKHIRVEGGAQKQRFKVQANEYDDNRHYFLAHYFKDNYEEALSNFPRIVTGVTVRDLEVWVLNKNSNVENTRNIVAFTDLGEKNSKVFQNSNIQPIEGEGDFPHNGANTLYENVKDDVDDIATALNVLEGSYGLQIGEDFELVESARKLQSSEYTLNSQLGYISVNSRLRSDEILAVAYQVDLNGDDSNVGEITANSSDEGALVVKLLKPTSFSPSHKTWDLMMKNIYKLDAYNISKDDFMLNVMYNDVAVGTTVTTLPTENEQVRGVNLLKLLNLDRLNTQSQFTANGDGMFDYEEGITINPSKGYIMFPELEPFGDYLRSKFGESDEAESQADMYTYDVLYDSTKTYAEQITEKNKFTIEGTYKSSAGSEIPLNAINIPKGSVKVTAGGRELAEGTDYTVDYYLGRVKILNEGLLQSGTPIDISLESNTMFSIQSKTLLGTTLEYKVNEDLTFGGSLLNLTERPLTQKVNVGNEPISNTIWGLNVNYETEVPFITKMVDMLPFISTKEPSKITASAEFAHLMPGHNKAIKHKGEAYLDDFEGATSNITMKEPYFWFLASTPKRFEEDYNASDGDIYNYNRNRSQLSWYFIDPSFYENNTPVSDNAISMLNTYEVKENQIFPNRDAEQGIYNSLSVFHLSYFPTERGPYNFDSNIANINEDGEFSNPEERWAGIMRNVRTSNFEEANVEFIEFWMMDPYAQDNENGIERDDPNPALYINLGNVSEDVLKDGRRSFEHGIPADGSMSDMDTTAWGLVSKRQVSANGFSDNGRDQQDVGYDGLTNAREAEWFIDGGVLSSDLLAHLAPAATAAIEADPAKDDYHFYKGGQYESDNFYKNDITNRYRYFTNPHGNSPTSTGDSEMQTSLPNNEDINDDNTLNQTNAYYEYKIDLSPANLETVKKYIVDQNDISVKMPNGQTKSVTWYQFKIPVREPDVVEGNISDFRSIRFMRMYMTGFNRDVTLRFAELNLVRGEWRKYLNVLEEGGEVVDDNIDLSNAEFDVGTVNIEENGKRSPVNYVLPPEVDRVIDPSNSQLRQLNEQSISLTVRDLPDGFAKGIYKNIRFDMRQYKRLKMFIHAEKLQNTNLESEELTVFVRLGTDIRENYYEYEIPVVLTPGASYSSNTADRKAVWPSENELNIPLSIFTDTKQERNTMISEIESGVSLLTEYVKQDGKNTVKVRGNPNLGEVVTFMIGVRNKRNDHRELSGEVWVNELRLTEFDEEGGWAANARVTTQLADLGSVTVAGGTSKPGFGSIEQKLNERQLDEIYNYDINTSLRLGQFFPENSGVKLPMYFGYAETFTKPKYNPLAKDIEFEKSLEGLTHAEKEELNRIAREYNMRKSLNFTGVKIGKAPKEPSFYDLNNWTFSYAYTQVFDRNVNLLYHNKKQHTGSINYVYNNRTTPWEPLKSTKINTKYFGLIKDFNLNYAPSQISFSSVVMRKYNTMKRRNLNIPDQVFDPTYDKNFAWNRDYGLVYNLSKSIKVSYNARATARIEEPEGQVERGKSNYGAAKSEILKSVADMGTMTQYNQTADITYQIPLNKIPGFQWMNATAGYNGLYNWQRGPELETGIAGNSISNSNRLNGALNMSFDRLFKKSKYISAIHRKFKKPLGKRFEEKIKYTVDYTKTNVDIDAGGERRIYHRLGTETVTVKLTDKLGNKIEVDVEVVDDKRILLKSKQPIEDAELLVTGEKERNQGPLQIASEYFVRMATGLESARINYTQNNGSMLNGFNKTPTAFGLTFDNEKTIPGWGYVVGLSDIDVMERVIRKGWFEDSLESNVIEPYTMTYSENLMLSGTLEPLDGLKIQLKSQYARTRNTNRYYYPDGSDEDWKPETPTSKNVTGNWSMSVWTFSSAFDKIDDKKYTNDVYKEFLKNRNYIANRQAQERDGIAGYDAGNINSNGFPDGFPAYSQDVVIPAFIAAYIDGPNPNNVALSAITPIFSMIRPDWRIDYDGLMQFSFFKSKFRSFKMQHSYKAVFTMGGYQNNAEWSDLSGEDPYVDNLSFIRSQQDNSMFITRYSVNQITVSEDFMPFLEFNMTWKNNVTTRMAFNKSRSLSLNTSNNNIAESRRTELVVGTGFRFDNLTLVMRTRGGGQRKFNSPVEIRADFSVKDDVKYVHKPQDEFTELVSGMLVYTCGLTADYRFSKNLELRAFLDYSMRDPKIQTTYKTTEINFGFSFNFRLVDGV